MTETNPAHEPLPEPLPKPLPPAATSDAVDVLAVGAHPDDVEWGCGGLIASLSDAGVRCGIVVLTRGESGTRGDAATRAAETAAGARILGAHCLGFLDCGDGGLRTGPQEEGQLMFFLRQLRPRVVLAPPPSDRHPDHERASAVVRAAFFYAGLTKRPAFDPEGNEVSADRLAAYRPQTLLHYMLHDPFDPDLIVDCTSVWTRKLDALAAHRSQFPAANGNGADVGLAGQEVASDQSMTWVSKRSFWDAIEGRARHYGQRIGVEFAEPLHRGAPVGLDPERFRSLFL